MGSRIMDLTRNLSVLQLLPADNITADGQGSSIDTGKAFEEALVVANVGPVTGTSPTLDLVVQDSEDDGASDAFSEVDAGLDGGTFQQLTDADANGNVVLHIRGFKRYLRIDHTVGGTSPDFSVGITFIGTLKDTE